MPVTTDRTIADPNHAIEISPATDWAIANKISLRKDSRIHRVLDAVAVASPA